jgi:hypothetical protein
VNLRAVALALVGAALVTKWYDGMPSSADADGTRRSTKDTVILAGMAAAAALFLKAV